MSGDANELLRAALDSLERTECQFWACEGPTLEPIAMKTCHRCETVARLRERLGLTITHLEETPAYEQACYLVQVSKDAHRPITIDEALKQVARRRLLEDHGTDPARTLMEVSS